MKRKMAFLLAVVLTVSAGFMAYATGPDTGVPLTEAVTSQEPSVPETEGDETVGMEAEGVQAAETQPETTGTDSSAGVGTVPGDSQEDAGGSMDGTETSAAGNEGSDAASSETTVPGSTETVPDSSEIQDSQEAPEPGKEPDGAEVPGQGSEQDNTEVPGLGNGQDNAEGSGSGNEADNIEDSEPGADEEMQLPEEGDALEEEEEPGTLTVDGATGQVDVSIGAALLLEQPVTFEINLTSAADGKRQIALQNADTITLGGSAVEEKRVSFEGLSDGVYALTVSAGKFETYTQNISVENGRAYAVNLATGFLGGITYTEGLAHPGVLVIGDVDGNRKADDTDRKILVDEINRVEGKAEAGSASCDLNGDGLVNLVDLEYFAKAYHDTRDMQAGLEVSVSSKVIQPSVGEGTVIEGAVGAEAEQKALENLFRHEGSVTLMPAAGGFISEEKPVRLQFDFADAGETVKADGIIIETGGENPVSKATVSIDYVEEGIEKTMECPVTEEGLQLLAASSVRAERDGEGNIHLHLGGQVAVKRVTISIKGMLKNNNLAEISRVEFVNGMEERIPEPELDIPENLRTVPGSQMISLSWDAGKNVTGYEVAIAVVPEGVELTAEQLQEWEPNKTEDWETIMVAGNAVDISSYKNDSLINYRTYVVKVQSVNGTWRSGYGAKAKVIPMPNKVPDKPDMVKADGRYKSIAVSWKDMDDTVYYNLFYKKYDAAEYTKIEKIKTNSYLIEGLEDLTEYTLYVVGGNELGESGPSLNAVATTTDLNPAVMPKYKLINVETDGQIGAHIISAKMVSGSVTSMVDSPLDEQQGTAWGTVDHDPASYYLRTDWDDGASHTDWNGRGLTYEFDQAYKMDTIAFYACNSQDEGYANARVRFWDESGNEGTRTASLQKRTDDKNRVYYVMKLAKPVTAKKIQLYIGRGSSYVRRITVAEVYFYYYDSIFADIMALYEDDLHTVLKADTTLASINALRARVNTVDEVSKEYHPDSEMLLRELQTAEDILNNKNLGASVRIHSTIRSKDVSRGFGGLNAWQPLGITAAAGEKLMVYVGHGTKKTGDSTNLQLIATQYNSEANAMSSAINIPLKVGANEITVPKIWSLDYESGGALYVQYTGSSANDDYAVRVSGGVQVPILDLYQVTDDTVRLEKTKAYVQALSTYVKEMPANHEKYHKASTNTLVNKYDYKAETCILGASDIMLDTMMFSLPATQIWAGSGGNSGLSVEEQAQRILNSMDAMEDMMYLFYQHKGLNKNATEAINQIPSGHQNIRYQRMFAKAFMYASGNHIGIGYGSTAGMVASSGIKTDENGKYVSGSWFGWGIAHEIGHCINQGAYSVAEITNNYFSVLAQAKDRSDSVRFKYANVYDKVTSGTKGQASNVFTQLGLYWQLHLAYDNGYNFKTYENYDEQLANLFFARVDTYARSTAKAPAPGGVALVLTGDKDQALMRLSCAAAEKNILDFFERWGMTPDETTLSYASQFPVETRAIYYVNDDAKVYRLVNNGSILGTEGKVEAVSDTTSAKLNDANPNRIDFTLGYKNVPEADVLGYEIVRCTISGGEVERRPVGFVQGSTGTFSDIITTLNNRVVYYEITLIDQYLNRSAVKETNPIKVEHEGSLDKSFWTVSTQNLTVNGESETGSFNKDGALSCEEDNEATDNTAYIREKDKLIDNDAEAVYTAVAGGASQITLNFGRTHTVGRVKLTGVSGYTGAYEIEVCYEGIWKSVDKGELGTQADKSIHFTNAEGKYVSTYVADALRLTLSTTSGSTVSIAELDVLGPTSDNVDFRRTEGDNSTVVIGKLKEAFKYGSETADVIPAGSIVFAGSYKGNAAYNVVLLYDQDGNIVGQVAEDEVKATQVILSHVEDGDDPIQNVADGIWIYWVEPQTDLSKVTKVRAELYRVNNAETNEGQRLVSDSLFEAMPEVLPEVTLDGAAEPWK